MKQLLKEKALSKGYIQWSLCIGKIFGTMSYGEALKIAKVKRYRFNDWYFGKKTAPQTVFNLLMSQAFFPNISRRKILKTDTLFHSLLTSGLSSTEIAARFEWKVSMLNELNPLLIKKVFKMLKCNYKKRVR